MRSIVKLWFLLIVGLGLLASACTDDEPAPPIVVEPDPDPDPEPEPNEPAVEPTISNLLINQVDEVIIPTYFDYQEKVVSFTAIVDDFVSAPTESSLNAVREAYLQAYRSYQAAAVHNYYATSNVDLVNTTNLYPIDVTLLDELISSESYNFNTTAQRRANGYPALDYLLYGDQDVLAAFANDPKRTAFLQALVGALQTKADDLVQRWTGTLRDNFVNNGGVALGSSVSVQLNRSLVYYEEHIRGNKVGLPIGRLGPNDTPIARDASKIESYYKSLQDNSDETALELVRVAVEEMEDIYLGSTSEAGDGIGYEDLLLAADQESLDTDIKAQYQQIYDQIAGRTLITGDENLYNSIQALITLYKSDLFPVLNVQDADGANDGD